ncbi:MAG: DUF3108 domain-containing protein, partial [Candidatus Krumholzibacteria bacterium]|nr:DUF3108 domain-containing protein [Candidatus Krumholzibacteria bacterium]
MLAIAGHEMAFDVKRKIETATLDSTPVWRIISAQQSPMFAVMDTFDIDRETLLPLHRSMSQGQATITMEYGEDAITGEMKGPRETSIDVDLTAPVFGDDAGLEIAINAMPLAPGYRTTLRIFDMQMRKVRPMSLTVTGEETVTVPAGSFDVFKLELKALDGEMGGGTIFINA